MAGVRDEDRVTVYLAHLARTGRKLQSMRAAGMRPAAATELRKADPAFSLLEGEALARYGELLEAEAHRRGVEGWDEPVFFKGEVCGHVRRHSDRLLELALKKNVPEWRDKLSVDAKLTGGVLVVGPPAASPEDWARDHSPPA